MDETSATTRCDCIIVNDGVYSYRQPLILRLANETLIADAAMWQALADEEEGDEQGVLEV